MRGSSKFTPPRGYVVVPLGDRHYALVRYRVRVELIVGLCLAGVIEIVALALL